MHQLQNFEVSTGLTGQDLSWKEFFRDPCQWWDNRSSKRHPDFKHRITKEPLWMDGHNNSSWVKDQLIRHAFLVENGTTSIADALSPSLIWACCKNKDLPRGTRIHHELQKRGLVTKDYSDALITMYAKCGELKKAQALLDMHESISVIPWTALIAGYIRLGQCQNAFNCFEQMQRKGIPPNAVTYLCILKACAVIAAIDKGRKIHDEILRRALLNHSIELGNALVDMYAKCGALSQARNVLEKLPSRNVVSWNCLITGYVQKEQGQQALGCFSQMQHEGISPDVVTYVCILKACALITAIDKGKQFHDEILRQGLLEHNIILGGALVDMYAKCGTLPRARSVLEELPSRDVVSWSALIGGYAEVGQGQQALDCFVQMQREGIFPNSVTYVCILKACATIGAIDKGKQIHDEISKQGLLEHSVVLGGALVDMYAKCGALSEAHMVLEKLSSRNVVSWSALIAGYAKKGQGQQALECFEEMQREGIPPDAMTYVCSLKACADIRAIDKGKKIHDEISRQGLLEHNKILGGALVDMYAKCGALPQARSVLEKLSSRDIASWSALIVGYAQKEQGLQALECFEQMQHEGIPPVTMTYLWVLKACAMTGAIDKGKEIHIEMLRQGLLEHDIVLGNALVDMYVKCGAIPQALSVLEKLPSRNVVSWSALIAGYAQKGQGQKALECLDQMQYEGISPNAVTYMCILRACAAIGAIDKGKQIHDEILRQGLLTHSIELGNSLVDMYAKCGALSQAQSVLEKLPSCNVISWSALIAGYVQHGQALQALECLDQMHQEGIIPNAVTYVCILKACAASGAIDKGKQIHDEISRQGLLDHSVELGGALVDMYAKCGALFQAHSVLLKLPSRNVVSWSALIAGYAQQGQGEQALNCFQQMQHEGILPDTITFLCLLTVCSHLGLVEKAQELFDNMGGKYGLKPDVECFICMVDLLGRAGLLVKAVEVIQKMPFSANSAIWLSLLGACRKWVDVNVAICAFKQAVKLDKCNGAAYTLMVNIYAEAGMLEKVEDIEAMRIENKAWKQPGSSLWTDLNIRVHLLCVGDTKHARSQGTAWKLENMAHAM